MAIGIRYAHTNLIAKDWRSLVRFYMEVFGCEPAGPERDQRGTWLDQATGLRGAHLQGIHLRLPGHGNRARPSRSSPATKHSNGRTQSPTEPATDMSLSK